MNFMAAFQLVLCSRGFPYVSLLIMSLLVACSGWSHTSCRHADIERKC